MKISKENAEHYKWGNECDGWFLMKNKDLSIIHEKMPCNTSEVRHYHETSQQFFFVLKGIATLEVNQKMIKLNQFEGIEIPPLTPHQMLNQSEDDIEFLVISQPNSHGDRAFT